MKDQNLEYYERAAELLRYDSDTGNLIWKVNRSGAARAGIVAGSLGNRGYIVIKLTLDGEQKTIPAHRVVFFIHHGYLPEEIDHIDNNTLNNRIENLRGCTHQQNMRNRLPHQGGSSQYLGVTWDRRNKKWKAQIGDNGVVKHLGRFFDEEEAARAYDEAAKIHHGEFANLNFK